MPRIPPTVRSAAVLQIEEVIAASNPSRRGGPAVDDLAQTRDQAQPEAIGQHERARAHLQIAVDTASEQGANLLALRAANPLAESWLQDGRTGQARSLLSSVLAKIPAGKIASPESRKANALLARGGRRA